MTNRTDESLADAIIRLQRMALDEHQRRKLEEAWELLNEGRQLEAQALVENADAWIRQAEKNSDVVRTPSL